MENKVNPRHTGTIQALVGTVLTRYPALGMSQNLHKSPKDSRICHRPQIWDSAIEVQRGSLNFWSNPSHQENSPFIEEEGMELCTCLAQRELRAPQSPASMDPRLLLISQKHCTTEHQGICV